MSFKLFIYYCALCGGWAAFVAWGVGRFVTLENRPILEAALKAMALGMLVALALGLVDALWNFSPWQVFSIGGRVLTAVVTRLVCLAGGQVIADGVPSEVLASDAVKAAFLGGGVL